MTEEQSKRIADLTADLHNKRARYQVIGAINNWGLSAKEMHALAVEYNFSHGEYIEALALLDSAIRHHSQVINA